MISNQQEAGDSTVQQNIPLITPNNLLQRIWLLKYTRASIGQKGKRSLSSRAPKMMYCDDGSTK